MLQEILPFTTLEESLIGLDSKKVRLAYEQSYSIVKYMIATYGWYKVKDLLDALGNGRDVSTAITGVFADFRLDYKGLVREWQESVLREYRK